MPRLFKAVRSPPLETLPRGQPCRVGRSATQCCPEDRGPSFKPPRERQAGCRTLRPPMNPDALFHLKDENGSFSLIITLHPGSSEGHTTSPASAPGPHSRARRLANVTPVSTHSNNRLEQACVLHGGRTGGEHECVTPPASQLAE